ncbi:protein FAR1-RELATED SEQUENCE 6-like [Cornus florida]|uniref:protein FAR1-RELATED SEQUENCE 6-like n=1 Tax=Cornus florida TaxID=4283 RepID=UPI00289D9A5D|nr:protein FAR1-RELATED SEQUENCE 6-like [Cornus florida]
MEEDSHVQMMINEDNKMPCGQEIGNDDRTNEQELEGVLVGDEGEKPKAGMVFYSEEEVRNFYNNYAQRLGFGVTKISVKNGNDGKSRYFSLACAQHGKSVSTAKDSYHPRPSTKTNCKAKINVTAKDDGRFIIARVYLDHNHALNPGKVRLRCNKALDSHVKRKLELNDLVGIKRSKNFHSFVEACGFENLLLTGQLRLRFGDAEALCNYFYRMQNRNSNFFFMIDMDGEGCLRNVFWADSRCRAMYESFGDVITFDTTYLTKKYDMPLASFVGVNHHGQSVLLGCGLLSNQDTDTYTWLFKSWLACMLGCAPKAIVTDECKAIQEAVLKVFPDSRHRLCLWHIMQKLPVKLGGLAQYKMIKKIFENIVYESVQPDEFEKSWAEMSIEYNLENNEWLKSLYADRHCWVPLYVKWTFWAGMSTTQRGEGMNAFFDEYVHSKTTLKQFVEHYDNALKSKVEKERKADLASFSSTIPTITVLSIEKQFQNAYTNEIFKLFQDEMRGLIYCNVSVIKREGPMSTFEVTESVVQKDGIYSEEMNYEVVYNETECKVQCLCHLFEFQGILCRHAISVMMKEKMNEVPSHYILERWRKDIKRGYTFMENAYDDYSNNEQRHRSNKLNPLFHELQELGAESDYKCEVLIKLLKEAKETLLAIDSSCETRQINQVIGASN